MIDVDNNDSAYCDLVMMVIMMVIMVIMMVKMVIMVVMMMMMLMVVIIQKKDICSSGINYSQQINCLFFYDWVSCDHYQPSNVVFQDF